MKRPFRIVAWGFVALAVATAAATAGFAGWARWKARDKGAPDNAVRLREYKALVPEQAPPPMYRIARVGGRHEILDRDGRVVVLRGMNLGSGARTPPWRAIERDDVATFDRLRSWGVNALRLALPWEAIEPRPREPDAEVVSYLKWFVDQADRHGMVVIVDNHQDHVSRCLGGVGAPPWAHRPGVVADGPTDGDCRHDGPAGLADLPGELRWWADFLDASWTPDDVALQDHVIWSFMQLAATLRGHPALLGYGPLDAPRCYAGALGAWLYPGERDCEEALSGFYRQFGRGIRAMDLDALVFLSPPVPWPGSAPDGAAAGVVRPDVDGVAWSVSACDGDASDRGCDAARERERCGLADLLAESSTMADARFDSVRVLSGFGVSGRETGAADALAHMMLDVEDAMASAFVTDFALEGGKPPCHAGAFVRPYPQRIAGVPVSWGWDHSYGSQGGGPDRHHDGRPVGNTDVFTLVFRQGESKGETLVWVPRKLVFAEDPRTEAPEFVIDVSDGEWRWSSWDANVLVWTTRPDRPEHRLELKPWGGGRAQGNGVGDCVGP